MRKEEFISLLREKGLFLTENQVSQFEKYLYLIQEHNKVMNLTGITEEEEVYEDIEDFGDEFEDDNM